MLDSTNENNFVIMPSLLPQNQTTEAFKIDSQTYGITAPRMTPSVIDNSADDKVLITKEWFQLNSSTGGSTDYISNVQANVRTITFTGVGNAFNGSVTINQDISLAPTTQTIDIGDIGTSTIEDGFNAFTFSENVQEQNEGYVLINTVQNGLPTQYLFVGTGGAYGTTGTLTAIDEDFTFIESTDFIDDTWRNSSGTQIAYGYNESIRHGGEVRANSFKVEDASDGGVIQNRRFGDLLIQGYTNLTLRGANPNNSQVRITSNGSITAYDADRYRYNLIASRNYDSQAVYINGARKTLVGIGITDRVLLTDAVNSPNMDYAALLINPNIVPGTETDKLFSIVSEIGDVVIKNGKLNLSAYGQGNITGTETQYLGVDSTGNVIELSNNTWNISTGSSGGDTGNQANTQTGDIIHGGNVFVNQIRPLGGPTNGILNRGVDNLYVRGNQSVIIQADNANEGNVILTTLGKVNSYDSDPVMWNVLAKRSYDDNVIDESPRDVHFVGIEIADVVDLGDKQTGGWVGSKYSALRINPSVTNTPSEQINAITSERGNVVIKNGILKADQLNVSGIGTYVDDAAAGTAGLISGDVYKQPTGQLMVKN